MYCRIGQNTTYGAGSQQSVDGRNADLMPAYAEDTIKGISC